MAVSLGPKARAEHALRDHDKRGALMTVWEAQGNPYKIETTAKRNGSMVFIMRNQSANLQARNGTTSPYPRHSSGKTIDRPLSAAVPVTCTCTCCICIWHIHAPAHMHRSGALPTNAATVRRSFLNRYPPAAGNILKQLCATAVL